MHVHHRSPFAPLPGTTPAPRALFLDRWGPLLQLPEAGPVRAFAELRFAPGALDVLFRAGREGWHVYLIGNEDDVAHGRVSDDEWNALDGAFHDHLAAHGVVVRRDYTCTDDPAGGVPSHRAESVYRLPNTGAFYHAAHNDGIALGESWVIGDSTLELAAGWRASCRTLGLACGQGLGDGSFHVDPDLRAPDLRSGLLEILALGRGALR